MLTADGVRGTPNENGQMYGRNAVYDIIRKNSAACTDEVMEAIFSQIYEFLKTPKTGDDLTLVVVKVL